MITNKEILFFADRLYPNIGGMEVHAEYFLRYFQNNKKFLIKNVVTCDEKGNNYLLPSKKKFCFSNAKKNFKKGIVFFNSGRWIEDIPSLRKLFPDSIFVYRTGGNEIIKAPLRKKQIHQHGRRQEYWVKTINDNIDTIITNSKHTECRLREIGISIPFLLCVGGVEISNFQKITPKNDEVRIFCAARFVPYKNHDLLVSVIKELKYRGFRITLRLAGDGPLLESIKRKAHDYSIEKDVKFLGKLSNYEVCKEMRIADIYMQLSTDYITKVSGGEYMHTEGMGRSILEAITAGTFIIAGFSGALKEIITSEQGILVSSKNSREIADLIEPFIRNNPQKGEINGIYSWDKVFFAYEQLFSRI